MSRTQSKSAMSPLFPTLAALKQAVGSARSAALEEARETVGGRGFFRNNGAEFCAADAEGHKVSEDGVHPWDGTRRSFEEDIRTASTDPPPDEGNLAG